MVENMKSKKLSIVIPTYNRQAQLKTTIEKLLKQSEYDFNIHIIDNASSYSVEDSLKDIISQSSVSISIHSRKNNVGGDINIAEAISFADGEYAWLLGDDDNISDDAIKKILNSINNNSEASVICFNMYPREELPEIFTAETINEYFDYSCNMKYKYSIDYLYISTKIYKVQSVSKYISYAIQNAYLCMSQGIIILQALLDNHKIAMINDQIAAPYDFQTSWNWLSVAQKMSNISYLFKNIDTESLNNIRKGYMPEYKWVINQVLDRGYCRNNKFYLHDLYYGCYVYILKGKDKFVYRTYMRLLKNKFSFYITLKIRELKRLIRKRNK